MMLLPPRKGTCPACAVQHAPDLPHDCRSLYYQYRFFGLRGRWPTWADASAHCSELVVRASRDALQKLGIAWTEPPEGVAVIADPPHDSLRQPVGDPNSSTFGPGECRRRTVIYPLTKESTDVDRHRTEIESQEE